MALVITEETMDEQLALCEELMQADLWMWDYDKLAGSVDCFMSRKAFDLFVKEIKEKNRCVHCGTTEVLGDTGKCEALVMD